MNKAFSKIWIVVILVALFAGGILVWQYSGVPEEKVKPPEEEIEEVIPEEIPEEETADWQSYKNEKYGFSFKYPQDYILKEVGPNFILLRKSEDEEFDWIFEVFVREDQRVIIGEEYDTHTAELSFGEFAIAMIKLCCFADGPTATTYCTEVVKQDPFTINDRIKGYEIYITEVREIFDKNEKMERIKGPIFALDISQQTKNLARGIFFQLTRRGEESLEKENLIQILNQILSTFRFLE